MEPRATGLLAGADALAFVDIDSVQRRVYGGNGHDRGARRLRLLRQGVHRRLPPSWGEVLGHVRLDPKIKRTITTIDEHTWVPIKYPNAN